MASLLTPHLKQHGQENSAIFTLQLSTATLEKEFVDVNLRLNQAVRQQFLSTSSGVVLISRGLGSYFKTGPLFVGLTWLVFGISEERIDFTHS